MVTPPRTSSPIVGWSLAALLLSACEPTASRPPPATPVAPIPVVAAPVDTFPIYSISALREELKPGLGFLSALEGGDLPEEMRTFRVVDASSTHVTTSEQLARPGEEKEPTVRTETWESFHRRTIDVPPNATLTDEILDTPDGPIPCTQVAWSIDLGQSFEVHRTWFERDRPGPAVMMSIEIGGRLIRSELRIKRLP